MSDVPKVAKDEGALPIFSEHLAPASHDNDMHNNDCEKDQTNAVASSASFHWSDTISTPFESETGKHRADSGETHPITPEPTPIVSSGKDPENQFQSATIDPFNAHQLTVDDTSGVSSYPTPSESDAHLISTITEQKTPEVVSEQYQYHDNFSTGYMWGNNSDVEWEIPSSVPMDQLSLHRKAESQQGFPANVIALFSDYLQLASKLTYNAYAPVHKIVRKFFRTHCKKISYAVTLRQFQKVISIIKPWIQDYERLDIDKEDLDKAIALSFSCIELYPPANPVTVELTDYQKIIIEPQVGNDSFPLTNASANVIRLAPVTWLRIATGYCSIAYCQQIGNLSATGEAIELIWNYFPLFVPKEWPLQKISTEKRHSKKSPQHQKNLSSRTGATSHARW